MPKEIDPGERETPSRTRGRLPARVPSLAGGRITSHTRRGLSGLRRPRRIERITLAYAE